MINQFNDVEARNSGIIYKSTLEQIKKLYAVDPEQAGELAIAAIELVLTGQISTDDVMIDMMLTTTKAINANNGIHGVTASNSGATITLTGTKGIDFEVKLVDDLSNITPTVSTPFSQSVGQFRYPTVSHG